MNRFLLLIFIAGITFLVVLFIARPDLLDSIWIWLIGFAGGIVKIFDSVFTYFKNLFKGDKEEDKKKMDEQNENNSSINTENKIATVPPFKGTTLKLLRYSDDGDTTIGLLFVNGSFYCYTLEDTFREEKVDGETRISAGIYNIQYRKEETKLTMTYRTRYPEWFTYHIQLNNVPLFDSIYIHNGGDHTHTEGCILVSDSINVNSETTILSNSRNTFKRLYRFISEKLDDDIRVRIVVRDEKWFKDVN